MKTIIVLVMLASSLCATSITFKGEEVTLNSKGLKVGDSAPFFMAVNKDFIEVPVGGEKDKVQVIAFVPSFDTGICKLETIAFNQKMSQMKNVEVILVSKDLPFAIGRFCNDNNIKNVNTVSDYKDVNNVLRYGVTISAPVFLEGFFGRVVYVVGTDGKIAYKEIVSEITNEPNYERVIKAVNSLSKK
ncbi:MAG: thiol peroxidase [Campylobacterota bacterium]|nr:thiol peroxidase [Campylobacterota bacterium]